MSFHLPRIAAVLWTALCLVSTAPLHATTASSSKPARERSPDFVFSLLPRSFQRNPRLDVTVITEVTKDGKKLPPVSKTAPAYFIPFAAGCQQLGATYVGESLPVVAELERHLQRSLAAYGYLPAQPPATPPSLVIIYSWGTHNDLEHVDYSEIPGGSPLSTQQVARHLYERALLIGGSRFAREFAVALVGYSDLSYAPVSSEMLDFASPLNLLRYRNENYGFLLDHVADELYFLVASAYDYNALSKNEKKLLWRTRITVSNAGVSMKETVPALIASAGPFFGKEMDAVNVVPKRLTRGALVEVGTARVIEDEVPASAVSGPRAADDDAAGKRALRKR
jgi:hypothetical protein